MAGNASRKETGKTTFRVIPFYKEDESANTPPWASKPFTSYEEFSKQLAGFAKIAFKRGLWREMDYIPSPEFYFHTGLALPRQDGQADIFEVQFVGNLFRMRKKEAAQLIEEEAGTSMFFDNTSIPYKGAIDTKKTLFRLSKIMDKTINYKPTSSMMVTAKL